MKRFFAESISTVGVWVIQFIDFAYNLNLRVLTWAYSVIRAGFASVFYFLVKTADKERIEAAEQLVELKAQNIELKLLASASQVRDHAVETDDWTEKHTEAIEAIGDALLDECNWEEEHVHNYLREIVQSVDGLTYELFDDEGDAV